MVWSDQQLSAHKKAQAGISLAGSALGLSALSAKGGAALLPKVARAGRLAPLAPKLDRAATNLTIGGAGLGGVGGINVAGIQSAEAKKKVSKAMTVSAWGVDHGTEVSKGIGDWKSIDQRERAQVRSRRRQRQATAVGMSSGALAGSLAATHIPETKTAVRDVKSFAHMAGHGQLKTAASMAPSLARSNPFGAAVGVGAGLAAGALVANRADRGVEAYHQHKINERRRARVHKAMSEELKEQRRSNAKVVSEHRSSGVGHGALAGLSVGAGLAAGSFYARGAARGVRGVGYAANRLRTMGTTGATQIAGASATHPFAAKVAGEASRAKNSLRFGVAAAKQGQQMASAGRPFRMGPSERGVYGGILGASYGAKLGASHGERQGRKDPRYVASAGYPGGPKPVSKAYDPERGRAKRLNAYQTGAGAAAGALGVGAGFQGAQAARKLKPLAGRTLVPTATLKGAAKHGAAGVGLGLGAVGAGIAAQKIGDYRRGNGRPYRAFN